MQSRERFGDSGNLVRHQPDRPPVVTFKVEAGFFVHASQRMKVEYKLPLTAVQVVRGRTIGGGTSKEALRRARKRFSL